MSDIRERIRKLRAMTEANGCTFHESRTAQEIADRLEGRQNQVEGNTFVEATEAHGQILDFYKIEYELVNCVFLVRKSSLVFFQSRFVANSSPYKDINYAFDVVESYVHVAYYFLIPKFIGDGFGPFIAKQPNPEPKPIGVNS